MELSGRSVVIFIFATFIVIACANRPDEADRHNSLLKETTIFFFDIKQYSRGELATFIESIDKFEPNMIAVHAVFPSQKKF